MAQQQININIPADQLEDLKCGKCGGSIAAQALWLKKVPAIYSASGKPEVRGYPIGFVCVNCGANMLQPPKKEEEENGIEVVRG